MRIISGKFRGLKLHSPTNIEIRPTSDRLRESLFSIINSNKYDVNIIDANVIDICTVSYTHLTLPTNLRV